MQLQHSQQTGQGCAFAVIAIGHTSCICRIRVPYSVLLGLRRQFFRALLKSSKATFLRGACVGAGTRPVWHFKRWSTMKFFFLLILCPGNLHV